MVVSLLGLILLVEQPTDRPSPESLTALRQCRELADANRLRCYDQAVGALDAAVSSGAVTIVGREEIQHTRRSLFGLRLPATPLLGDANKSGAASIATTIRAVQRFERDKWVLELADGAVWQTTEGDTRSVEPRPNDAVTIRRGSLGSYILKWSSGRAQRAIRVR